MSMTLAPSMPATTELAQTARGSKTCQRCGRTKPLATWPLHPRWKKPLNICNGCMAEARLVGAKKNSATKQRKRHEREIAAANEAAVSASAVETVPAATTPSDSPSVAPTSSVALLLAKLEGYALGKDDPALTKLVEELRTAARTA